MTPAHQEQLKAQGDPSPGIQKQDRGGTPKWSMLTSQNEDLIPSLGRERGCSPGLSPDCPNPPAARAHSGAGLFEGLAGREGALTGRSMSPTSGVAHNNSYVTCSQAPQTHVYPACLYMWRVGAYDHVYSAYMCV